MMPLLKPKDAPEKTDDMKKYHQEYGKSWYSANRGKTKIIVCPDCGNEVEKYRGGRCRSCYFERDKQRRLVARGTGKCIECHSEFTPRIIGQKYCSGSCSDKKRWRSTHVSIVRPCKKCGSTFQQIKYTQVFCTPRCSDLHRQERRRKNTFKAEKRIDAKCRHCTKTFTQPQRYYLNKSSGSPQFCSTDCHYAYKRTLRGKPPNLGGVGWVASAKEARITGNNQCCICFAKEFSRLQKNSSVDHIIPRRLMERWGINPHQQGNLACLCTSCHGKKTAIEWMLFKGDMVGFVTGLARMSYPKDRVSCAFALAQLSVSILERVYA